MNETPTHQTGPNNSSTRKQRRATTTFWIVVGALSVLSLVLMTLGASIAMAKKGGEKLLRAEVLFPKLKGIAWDPKSAIPAPKTLEPVPAKKAPAPAPPPPVLPTMTQAPKAVALDGPPPFLHGIEPPMLKVPDPTSPVLIPKFDLTPPPIVETCDDPIIYLHPCNIPRGDSPMIRNWKTMTMYSTLAVATMFLAPQPIVFAQEKKSDVSDELLKSLQDISKRLEVLEKKKTPTLDTDAITEALRAELRKLENGVLSDVQSDIKGVKKSVDAIKSDVGSLQAEQLRHKLKIEQLIADVESLRSKPAPAVGVNSPVFDKSILDEQTKLLKAIHEAITKLGPTEKRVMMSPPNPTGNGNIATPVVPTVGKVVLTNLYSAELLFIVNNVPYRLAAKSTKVLEMPTGTMNYEVFSERWGSLERSSTNITAGDTFTLAANSR